MKNIKKGLFTRIKHSELEGSNYVGHFSRIHNCKIGRGTYCGTSCKFINVKIGRYCSIASNVKILFGEHPTTQWITTFPGFYSLRTPNNLNFTNTQKFEEYKYTDNDKKTFVEIGNDVWIATDVKIMSGVKIGDGAVIAAGAIVTKDVQPYKIVGGVPAKEIGQRFVEDDIDFLLKNKWWEKDLDWLKENSECFSDINKYREACSKNHN